MEVFEDMCIKILDKIDYLVNEDKIEEIKRYTAKMRNEVETCRNVSKNERQIR